MQINFIKTHSEAKMPRRATSGAAGYDLYSTEDYYLLPGERHAFRTGLKLEIPEGVAMLICPRSGLAANHGLTVLNGPGVIDSDFRGELHVILINEDEKAAREIRRGDAVAQAVFVNVNQMEFNEVVELSATERGEGGLGSTGR